jgi:hypothetical protein
MVLQNAGCVLRLKEETLAFPCIVLGSVGRSTSIPWYLEFDISLSPLKTSVS